MYYTDYVRFAFLLNTDSSVSDYNGWYIDDVELFDLFNYDTEACVSSEQGDQACNTAPHRGVIVEPQLSTSVQEGIARTDSVRVYPNPAGDLIQVDIHTRRPGPGCEPLR